MNIERRDAEASGIERRVISLDGDLKVETRDGGQARRIVGHAAVFDRWTTLYESPVFVWKEVVRPGAFRAVIAERSDVRALWNHDARYILGRTASGTLRLSEDALGLLSDIDPPDTQTVRDLVLTPIARGDVSQMSFAFAVRRSAETKRVDEDGISVVDYGGERVTTRREGSRVVEERELFGVNLFDVSPVTYPAYEATDVSLRERGALRDSEIRAHVLAAQRERSAGRLRGMCMRLRLVDARIRGTFP
jgi:HK97 family phage prohead protease